MTSKMWNDLKMVGKYRRLKKVLNKNAEIGNGNLIDNAVIKLNEYIDEKDKREVELDNIRNDLLRLGNKLMWVDLLD